MTPYDDDRALADSATHALLTSNARLCAAQRGRGWSRQGGGAALLVSGGRIPTLNAVIVTAPDADVAAVGERLDELAATGLPHSVKVRPAAADAVKELLLSRGLSPQDELPLMVRTGAAPPVPSPEGLVVRRLQVGEMTAHMAMAAAGFEVPEEVMVEVLTDDLLALPGFRAYVGAVADEPVTTGVGMADGDWLGVFNVATPSAHRRRGLGAAITAHILGEGLAAGARAAYLHSSRPGLGVYERLGFRTVERWLLWW
ncbi:GNAT family N-acetyltransferase [Micromonospora sp. NPDC003776]